MLQQSCQRFMGPSGPGRASMGLVCGSTTAAQWWRWIPPAWLRICYPLSRRCRVSPPYRPRAIILEETVMVTTRPWWRVPVVDEPWWWCSGATRFFCWCGREKSLPACPTLMQCLFRVAPFLPGGHRGKPPSTLLRVGETDHLVRAAAPCRWCLPS
jgi:hypothetical protein